MIGMISTAPSAELTYGGAAAASTAEIELPTMAPIIGVLKRFEVRKKHTWCSFLRNPMISRNRENTARSLTVLVGLNRMDKFESFCLLINVALRSRGSAFGIVSRLRAGRPGFQNSGGGKKCFSFPKRPQRK
jgi:hypothetical protein